MCWADLTSKLARYFPDLLLIGGIAVYSSFIAVLIYAPGMKPGWKRTSRVAGIIGTIPLIFAIPVALFGLLLSSGEPAPQSRIETSLGGKQAKLTYQAGFLGRDYTEVILGQKGCCKHTSVFTHSGPSEFNDPQIHWLDSKHLQITYHARPDDPQHCARYAEDVAISCRTLPLN